MYTYLAADCMYVSSATISNIQTKLPTFFQSSKLSRTPNMQSYIRSRRSLLWRCSSLYKICLSRSPSPVIRFFFITFYFMFTQRFPGSIFNCVPARNWLKLHSKFLQHILYKKLYSLLSSVHDFHICKCCNIPKMNRVNYSDCQLTKHRRSK